MSVVTRRSLVALLGLLLAACQGMPATAPTTTAGTVVVPSMSTSTSIPATAPPEPAPDVGSGGTSPLAALVRPLGSARFVPGSRTPAAMPVTVSIPAIGIDDAPIVDVGVLPDGGMEIPGAREVGWYRYGPLPGESGSAVLAAHVAFDGRNGVFRRLADLEPGSVVEVAFDDGALARFVVTDRSRYPKDGIPLDRMFAKDGPPVLTLVTCGGAFDRTARSYEDNVVVSAVPLEVPGG